MPETTDPARGADPIDAQPTVTLPPALEAVAVTLTVDGNRVALTQPPTRAPEIPGYQIIEELGRGGMGVVYHAVQVRLNRPVALKMILAGEFAGAAERVRFMTEAEVIARLHHPNIVQLYEFNVHNGVPYFSLEFVDGGTLERRLARQPLAPAEAAALLETLARAIQYAHDHSVVHRDLKPSNILLEPLPQNGSGPPTGGQSSHRHLHGNSSFGTLSCVVRETAVVPKVTDFGLAKTSAGSTGLTQSGAIMGTPSYMAPEQAEGKGREVGPVADVYSLGAILYECLTGRPPFHAATPVDTIVQALNEEVVAPRRLQPNVPRDLETICLKCLRKDPARRYATADELAEDLRRLLSGESIKARPVGPVERSVRWARRRPAAAALLGVTTLAALVILVGGWASSARLRTALADTQEQRGLADIRRQEAEGERQRAQDAAAEADRQRQAVATSLRNRLDVVDDILFNMDARLENASGMESIRREFLDEVRRFSDQLLKENPDDPSVMRQSGRVYRSIGELVRRDTRQSDDAYRKALSLGKQLTEKFPDNTEYLAELTKTAAGRAMMLWTARRYKEAAGAYAEATELTDRLVDRPGQPRATVHAARRRYYHANVLEDLKQPADAVRLYRDALARQEKLATAAPTDTDLLDDLGKTAGSLALAVEPTDPNEAARLFRRALDVHRKVARLAPHSSGYKRNLRDAYDDYSSFCQRRHRDTELAVMAAEYSTEAPEPRYGLYNAACFFALAAQAVPADPAAPAAVAAARAESHAVKAIEFLDASAERGLSFDTRVHLLKDPDLDGLRDRADYRELLARLEKRYPGRQAGPADLLSSLQTEFTNGYGRYTQTRQSALTVSDKKRAARSKPDFRRVADRILVLTDDKVGATAALDALTWVLENGATLSKADPASRPAVKAASDQALARLTKYIDKPEFGNACRALGSTPSVGGDKLLVSAATEHRDSDVRGLAAFALGQSLAQQSQTAGPASDLQADLSRRAEDQFEKVAKEFDTVLYKDSTLGEMARRKLTELRSLSVGRKARDVEGMDLDGRPLTLTASRGRVTLVLFWANWCGYCRQMFPDTREWVSQYKDRPFALVGVNCDDDKAAAQRAVVREKLTWPSRWDGGVASGRLTEQWLVEAFPTLYLIDHEGVIRKKWEGKPESDEVARAIETLVRRAEQAKK